MLVKQYVSPKGSGWATIETWAVDLVRALDIRYAVFPGMVLDGDVTGGKGGRRDGSRELLHVYKQIALKDVFALLVLLQGLECSILSRLRSAKDADKQR